MTARPKTTRLAHFLEAYKPLAPQTERAVWDRVHRAGWSADDPASLQIAHDTITEARLAAFTTQMNALPARMAQATEKSLKKMQQAQADDQAAEREAIASRIAKEAREVLRASMPRLARQFHWAVALRLIATVSLLALFSAGAGYLVGRGETAVLQERYADLATKPDAQTWITLQRVNGNLDHVISRECRQGQEQHIPTASGRRACAVPLWLEGPSAPAPASLLGQAGEHLVSARATMPFTAILGLGILLGLGLLPLARRIYQWFASE